MSEAPPFVGAWLFREGTRIFVSADPLSLTSSLRSLFPLPDLLLSFTALFDRRSPHHDSHLRFRRPSSGILRCKRRRGRCIFYSSLVWRFRFILLLLVAFLCPSLRSVDHSRPSFQQLCPILERSCSCCCPIGLSDRCWLHDQGRQGSGRCRCPRWTACSDALSG